MRIIVCVKQIRFVCGRTGRDPEKHFLSPEDEITRINPYDEVALEIALCVREKQHGSTEIILMTLGNIIAEAELRRCLAMGADEICQIDDNRRLDPWQKSGLIAMAIRDLGADIVLCGKESLDTQNGQVGAFIAHKLGTPFISAITDLNVRDKKIAEARRKAGRGKREKIECLLPAVFTVDMGVHEPRLPLYEDKKKAFSSMIRTVHYHDHGEPAKTISAGTSQPRPRPVPVLAPDSALDSFERIRQLLMGSRVDKKGEIFRGSPDTQAENIITFLVERGFLKDVKL
ncbi:MAG: electron transfer flavoprotein subunit beta/FixA family protein [Deltaproteobacteria bacterium]|nr:electron transfer flavoprotein subunit beta/FixA family protein [Deltaproteobacteria bacterium]